MVMRKSNKNSLPALGVEAWTNEANECNIIVTLIFCCLKFFLTWIEVNNQYLSKKITQFHILRSVTDEHKYKVAEI